MTLQEFNEGSGPILTPEGLDKLLRQAHLINGAICMDTDEWGPLMIAVEGRDSELQIEEDDAAQTADQRFVIYQNPQKSYQVHLLSQQSERPALLSAFDDPEMQKYWTVGLSPLSDPTKEMSLHDLPLAHSQSLGTRAVASMAFQTPSDRDSSQNYLAVVRAQGRRLNPQVGHSRTALKGLGLEQYLIGGKGTAFPAQIKPNVKPVNAIGALVLNVRDPSKKKIIG